MDNNEYRIVPFSFKGFGFRSIVFNNDTTNSPWFINKEICDYLGHSNSRQAIRDANLLEFEIAHIEIGGVANSYVSSNGCGVINTYVTSESSRARHTQNMTIISESGLYKLIGNSRKSEAVEFQNWIYSVVIPCIIFYKVI